MGILKARILEWVAMPSSRGSSQPRDWTQVSRIADRFFYRLSHQVSPRTQEWVVGLLHVRLALYQLSYRVSFSLCLLSLKSHKIIWNGNFNNMLVSYQFSCSVMSNSLRPHGLQHAGVPVHHQLWSFLKLMSIETVKPSNHLILCHTLLLLPSIFPSFWVFSKCRLYIHLILMRIIADTDGGESGGIWK